jgi:hypothetical protein
MHFDGSYALPFSFSKIHPDIILPATPSYFKQSPPFGFSYKTLHAYHIPLMGDTFPTDLSLLELIILTLTILGEEYKL